MPGSEKTGRNFSTYRSWLKESIGKNHASEFFHEKAIPNKSQENTSDEEVSVSKQNSFCSANLLKKLSICPGLCSIWKSWG